MLNYQRVKQPIDAGCLFYPITVGVVDFLPEPKFRSETASGPAGRAVEMGICLTKTFFLSNEKWGLKQEQLELKQEAMGLKQGK